MHPFPSPGQGEGVGQHSVCRSTHSPLACVARHRSSAPRSRSSALAQAQTRPLLGAATPSLFAGAIVRVSRRRPFFSRLEGNPRPHIVAECVWHASRPRSDIQGTSEVAQQRPAVFGALLIVLRRCSFLSWRRPPHTRCACLGAIVDRKRHHDQSNGGGFPCIGLPSPQEVASVECRC